MAGIRVSKNQGQGPCLAEGVVDLAGDESFEAADGVFLGEAVGGAFREVGVGAGVPAESVDDDHVEGFVGLAVASAVEAVALCLT